MMATGTSDPVRRATVKGWPDALPFLTSPRSAGGDNPTEAIYCQVYGGTRCATWYEHAASADDDCTIDEDGSLSSKMALDNCTQLAAGEPFDQCSNVYSACKTCEAACMEAAIQDVKNVILPASTFVFILCGYLFITVLWNNVMLASEDLSGVKKMIGLGLNAGLVLFSIVMAVLCGLAISSASTSCQSTDGGCVPDTLYALIAISVGLMLVASLCLGGVQINNHMLLRTGTLIMVLLSLLCLLTGLIMGISSGVVMDDMEYYYDVNYPRLRGALEQTDRNYCKLRKADCTLLASNGGNVFPQICNEDYSECLPIEGAEPMTPASVWPNMWAVAAVAASDQIIVTENPWLEPCETSGVCIFCNEFYNTVQSAPTELIVDGAVVLCEGDTTTDTSDDIACLAAPNLDWKHAVTPPSSDDISTRWSRALKADAAGGPVLKCAESGVAKCAVAESTFPYVTSDCAAVTALDDSIACDAVEGCTYTGDGTCVLQAGILGASNAGNTGWADIISNYTAYQSRTWRANKLKCEIALMAHTKVEGDNTCKGGGASVPSGDAGIYAADCDSCNLTPDFSFSAPESSSYCLSYFVGHMEDACIEAAAAATCRDEFWTVADKDVHVDYFVDKAYEVAGKPDEGSADVGAANDFCSYSDAGCKTKIKHSIESSMQTVGIVGGVFVLFFIIIIYCTLQGIKIYKGDGGDDGGDDGGGEEISEE